MTKSTTQRGPKPTATQSKTPDRLYRLVGDFGNFSAAMLVLGAAAPDRMTLSQAIFFMVAATADLNGGEVTFSSVKEAIGKDLSKSLHTTYKIFLEPGRQFPKALHWLQSETNPNDNRVKFLKLTDKGRAVLKQVGFAMEAPHA